MLPYAKQITVSVAPGGIVNAVLFCVHPVSCTLGYPTVQEGYTLFCLKFPLRPQFHKCSSIWPLKWFSSFESTFILSGWSLLSRVKMFAFVPALASSSLEY